MMSDQDNSHDSSDVSIFNRASLQLTFDLLRKNHPQLALEVRNVIGGTPVSKDPGSAIDRTAENFRVDLSPERVRAVVHALMEFTQPDAVDIRNPQINIMARALLQDWLILAHKLVASAPLFPDLEPGPTNPKSPNPKSPNPPPGE